MSDLDEGIRRANAEKWQRLESLSDAELEQLISEGDQHPAGEAAAAQEELEGRRPTLKAAPVTEASKQATRSFIRVMGVLLCISAGGVLGFLLAGVVASGWFTPWQPVENAPERVARIVALDGWSVWVEAITGKIYYNQLATTCQTSCWVVVPTAPVRPRPYPASLQFKSQPCGSPPPLWGLAQSLGECQLDPFRNYSFAYALRTDGRLFVWSSYSGGEPVDKVFIQLPCVGLVGGLLAAFLLLENKRLKNQSRPEGQKADPAT